MYEFFFYYYYHIGLALYNDVHAAYGLTRKQSWSDITSVGDLQTYLQQLYPNQVEAFVGAMVEDHLPSANFGELMNTTLITQVRDRQ